MFKQITNLDGGEIYLITSLLIFLVFFLIVGLYLIKMNKQQVQIMSALPFNDKNEKLGYEEV